MRRAPLRSIASILLVSLAAASANAAVFTVDTLLDGPPDHDIDPGDGLCVTARSQCSLRAAIEQANTLDGAHEIRFSVSGSIAPSVEGPLPELRRSITLRGDTAPGYASGATDIGSAPPRIWLDGLFASGEFVWGRLQPPLPNDERRGQVLTRASAISLAARGDLAWLLPPDRGVPSAAARW